jgi:hypothetical protein
MIRLKIFKIYLNEKGLQINIRLFYQRECLYHLSSGSNFNIYNNGVTIPIDIVDGGDSTLDHGDYIDSLYPATTPLYKY